MDGKQPVNARSSVMPREDLDLDSMIPNLPKPHGVASVGRPSVQLPVEREQREQREEIFVSLTWSKLIFVTASLFAFALLLLGTLYLGHYMTIKSMEKKDLPEIKVNVPVPSVQLLPGQTVAPKTSDSAQLRSELDVLGKKLDEILVSISNATGDQQPVAFENAAVDTEAISEAVLKKISGANGVLKKDVSESLNNAVNNLKNEIKAIKAPSAPSPIGEDTANRIEKVLRNLEEITLALRSAERHGTALPEPIDAMSPSQRVEQLNDFAQLFSMRFERRNPEAKKEWDVKWASMIEARHGDKNASANERLLNVMSSLKGKKADDVKDDTVYDACRTFMVYSSDPKNMQFPSFFMSILKEDHKTYGELQGFLAQAVNRVK